MHNLVTEMRRILRKNQKHCFHFTPSCLTFPSRRKADEPRENEVNLQQSQLPPRHCFLVLG